MKPVYIWHHNDLDGITSATLVYDFIMNKRGTSEEIYTTPVTHGISIQKWREKKLAYPSIVVDYKFNPSAAIWIDHHTGQQQFVKYPRFVCKPDSPSCCRVVWNWLYDVFGYRNDKFSDLFPWLDIIDSANYKSAKQFVECKEPALKLNLVIYSKNDDPKFLRYLLSLFLKYKTFERIFEQPYIESLYKLSREKQLYTLHLIKKIKKIFHLKNGLNVCLVNIFKESLEGKVSFYNQLVYYLYPDIDVTVTIDNYNKTGQPTISLSVNPYKNESPNLNVAEIVIKFNGGGHKRSAGFQSNQKDLNKHINGVLKSLEEVNL